MRFLTSDPLDMTVLIASVQSAARGGVACFLGAVRDHHGGRQVLRLRYSAYEPMAEAELARIVAETESRWPVAVALRHRIGQLEVGDAAIAAVAAGAHRDEAFAACRYLVEEAKRRVPVWKQEFYADGTVEWVDPTGGRAPRVGGGTVTARVRDVFARPLRSLRVSVTDRCNMRCRYCMPQDDYIWLPRDSILTFEEIDRLAGIFAGLGVTKLRLTGGEPLLRHDLSSLVGLLRRHAGFADLAMTTNGILLAKHAADLRAAGLDRVTVSLDTLRPERMSEFARSARHADVLEGISATAAAGFTGTKLNTVVIRGFNDDEIVDLIEFGRANALEVRFIEYMDVGGATGWTMDQVVSRSEILDVVARRYGVVTPVVRAGAAPAERFALADGTRFGIIASTTAPFCRTCDRSRLTADGTWLLCLYTETGLDLREMLRMGASDEEIGSTIAATWRERTDRGAEERATLPDRGTLYPIQSLRADPRREMHTRGG